jgi:mannose-1-phosphate guanylyltransferase
MKAFLLAAGEGTRLRPITNRIPKCMVPIRGVPMLSISLRICEANGIDEILINGHAHADAVKQFLDHAGGGVRTRVAEEETLLGRAGTLRLNRSWVESEECFWIFYADVLNQADLKGMLRQHRQRKPVATLGVYEVPDPRRCGIVSLRHDGMVEQFVEKPDIPLGSLAFSGLMIGTPAMLDAIPDQGPADIGFHVLPKLGGKMLAFPIQDYLLDVGTLENYQKAQDSWPGLPEYA